MSAPPWMLLRLAIETAPHHATADEDRLTGLEVATLADYRAFLARIFGFESVVDRALERALARLDGIDMQLLARLRSHLLREDLHALGTGDGELAALPTAANVHVSSVPHALGWMFVLERHTLLAGLLRRHVLHALGADAVNATHYLGAAGATPGARFRAFGVRLGELARVYPPTAIAAGAVDAFRAQRHWYVSAPARAAAVA